jgi:heme/copper-type cytochrome/quinol oxidase subunit 1
MKHAIYCGLISAVIGFAVAAYVSTANRSTVPWMSTALAYILCPPGIIAGITMTDPDPESIWLFLCPLNALTYAAVGFTAWLFIAGGNNDSRRKEPPDRPLSL